jgi:hypothetical protein
MGLSRLGGTNLRCNCDKGENVPGGIWLGGCCDRTSAHSLYGLRTYGRIGLGPGRARSRQSFSAGPHKPLPYEALSNLL